MLQAAPIRHLFFTPRRIQVYSRLISNSTRMATGSDDNCIFCKIIKGAIPSFKLVETEFTYSFLDIGPLAKGHSLVIPKYHGEKLHDIPDEYLADTMHVSKKIVKALGVTDYNILQNNGAIAHQEVKHVHFHVIPKPNAEEGLTIGWPQQKPDMSELKAFAEELKGKL